MALCLDPNDNPILRIYGLFDAPGAVTEDGPYYLGVRELALETLGAEQARALVQFLREAASPALHECQLMLDGQPIISFKGAVEDWFDWDVIADLEQQGLLSDECGAILEDYREPLELYKTDHYWSQGADMVADCLDVVGRLAACSSGDRRVTLNVGLDKASLLEQYVLSDFPSLSGKVSVLVWRDADSMERALGSFRGFLEHMARAAARPILLLFYEPTEAYDGDYLKISSLSGPPEAQPVREQALREHLQALAPPVPDKYAELRMRQMYERRTGAGVGDLFYLPPDWLQCQSSQPPSYPAHPLFQGGPLRSLQVYALMAWLADPTQQRNGDTCFVLLSSAEVCLQFDLRDIKCGGESLFATSEKWQEILPPLVWEMQRSAGRERLRGLWAKAVTGKTTEDFTAALFFSTLKDIYMRFMKRKRRRLQFSENPPDLQLRIFSDSKEGTVDFKLDAPTGVFEFNSTPVGSIKPCDSTGIFGDMDRLAQEQLTRIVESRNVRPSPQALPDVQDVDIQGHLIWERFVPRQLQEAYNKLREEKSLALFILSDNPSFPWELVKPFQTEENPFDDLCWAVQFSLARWLTGSQPAREIGFGRVCCVATSSQLTSASKEVQFFKDSGVQLDQPQTRMELLDWLGTRDYDVLHFACHGQFNSSEPELSVVQLPDGSLFRTTDLLSEPVKIAGKLRQNRPLVFLNACHSGRVGPYITHLAGWAESFIDMGGGAFIGCGWEVADPLAADFAIAFYQGFRKESLTLGEAVRTARVQIREGYPLNSTGLAYYLYGDPNCRLKEPE